MKFAVVRCDAAEPSAARVCETQSGSQRAPMFDLSDIPFFVYVPVLALIFFALVGALTKLFLGFKFFSGGQTTCSFRQLFRGRPAHAAPRQPTVSQASADELEAHPSTLHLSNEGGGDPPSYYAGVIATNASAFYPMTVPQYSDPIGSMRDPRFFQGLAGVQAPPPYPPPPDYSQISSIPELPTMRLATPNSNRQSTGIAPVKSLDDALPKVD